MAAFSIHCRQCPRLVRHLAQVRDSHPDYHARPVPPFGNAKARLLVVGLAPGMHGANRTGRPFTGDYAGILLYETLHRYRFASQPKAVSRTDGLRLRDCRVTNAVRCLPPANRPEPVEIRRCNGYLATELEQLPSGGAVLALGKIAHDAVLTALGLARSSRPFAHGARHPLPREQVLFDSYHCSRYNTQTRRLTPAMFRSVVKSLREYLDAPRRRGGGRADR